MNINIRPDLQTMVRVQVLYKVIHELAKGFGVSDFLLSNFEKGILTRQLIKTIEIYYLNGANKAVGKVSMTVDWAKHQILAQSAYGKEFTVDPTLSIKEQISHTYPLLIKHTEDLKKAYGVRTINVLYTFTDEINADSQKYREASQFLGTVPGNRPEWAEKLPPDIELKFQSQNLAELNIVIEHNKPGTQRHT